MPTNNRFDAQRFLLTYSQVPADAFDANQLATFLYGIVGEDGWVEVNRELHQDLGLHYHALAVFRARYRGRLDSFDFNGRHPNFKVVRRGKSDLGKVRDYIRKDGVEHLQLRGNVPDYEPAAVEETERHCWGDLLESPTQAEFMANCALWFPKDYILRNDDLVRFAFTHYNTPSEYVPQWPRDAYTVPAAADEWVIDVLRQVPVVLNIYETPPSNNNSSCYLN